MSDNVSNEKIFEGLGLFYSQVRQWLILLEGKIDDLDDELDTIKNRLDEIIDNQEP